MKWPQYIIQQFDNRLTITSDKSGWYPLSVGFIDCSTNVGRIFLIQYADRIEWSQKWAPSWKRYTTSTIKTVKGKGVHLYNAVSSPLAHSKRFTLHPWRTCSLGHQLGFPWKLSDMLQLLRKTIPSCFYYGLKPGHLYRCLNWGFVGITTLHCSNLTTAIACIILRWLICYLCTFGIMIYEYLKTKSNDMLS